MRSQEEPVDGLLALESESHLNERGQSSRTHCDGTPRQYGVCVRIEQGSLTRNAQKGTWQGPHVQPGPNGEIEIAQCLKGAIFDVAADLRQHATTCCKWLGTKLSALFGRLLVVLEGFAHGYLTPDDDTPVNDFVTATYAPQAETGDRRADPVFAIEWPARPRVIFAKKV